MKTSSWIKLIGILCIVFGAWGIIDGISGFLIPEMMEMQEKSIVRLAYIGILINVIYLMAGVFFLIKKPFSLNMMYIALTISFLYGIAPMLFLTRISIFVLLGPFIDAALLIGVFRIGKYYFKSPDELIELFEGDTKRKTLTPLLLKILTFVGLLCLSIPLSIQILWIHVFNLGTNQAERDEIFHSYFPAFLHGKFSLIYLSWKNR